MSTSTITVYSSDGNIIFNSDRSIKEHEKKPKMMKMKKNIVNPIFEDMREHNDDPFWDMFLLKASRDNFPKGFSFKDDTLFFSLKAKYNFQYKIESRTENEFGKLKSFISDKGILSDTDKAKMTEIEIMEQDDTEAMAFESWKELGKLQNNAVFVYINTLSERYDLDTREKKNLESIVKIGISSGYLNDKNIVVTNSTIESIAPLMWNSEDRKFAIDTKNIRVKRPKVAKSEHTDVSTDNTTTCLQFVKSYNISNVNKRWEKFLNSIYG